MARVSEMVKGRVLRNDFEDRMCTFLRSKHPMKTTQCVSSSCGIPDSTVDKWLHKETKPSASHMISLIEVYGLEFLEAIFAKSPPPWLKVASLNLGINHAQESLFELANKIGGLAQKASNLKLDVR
jgi:hypothetical protein